MTPRHLVCEHLLAASLGVAEALSAQHDVRVRRPWRSRVQHVMPSLRLDHVGRTVSWSATFARKAGVIVVMMASLHIACEKSM